MTGKTTDPRVFISYSWSSPQHEQWVVDLAERLSADGVDTILDKWDLKEGQDKFHFMEQMVRDPAISKVLMICDQIYAEKANGRQGGVGTESQIISKELYENVTQEKFIPIVTEKTDGGEPCLPTFSASRIYIDFSSVELYEQNYERLLRNIYNRPQYQKPSRGVMPSFLQEESDNTSYRCISVQKQLHVALVNDRTSANGLLEDFFDAVVEQLESERGRKDDKDIDLKVLDSIHRLKPVRDSVINTILDLCKYRRPIPVDAIKEFLERLLQFNYRPSSVTSWNEYDFDAFKFFNYELLLYVLAALIKKRCFSEASEIIYGQFFYYDNQHSDDDITVFNHYIRSLEEVYKSKTKSNLITITGDKIKERAQHPTVQFSDLMLADCLIYFVKALRGRTYEWYPRLLVYRSHFDTFDFFVRLKSHSHFEKIKPLMGVSTIEEFKALVEEAVNRHSTERNSGSWNERSFPSVKSLAHLDDICSVP